MNMQSMRLCYFSVFRRFSSTATTTTTKWIYPLIKDVEKYDNYLTVKWQNGQKGRFLYTWLRENCPEDHTMRLTDISKSRKLKLRDLDLNVQPLEIENHIRSVFIRWTEDITGDYSSGWLMQRNCDDEKVRSDRKRALYQLENPILWNGTTMKDAVKCFEFDKLFVDQQSLLDLLTSLLKYGLVLIRNAPQIEGRLELLINLIGYHYMTPYGNFWFVRADPNPTHQAYTSDALAFHMDLPYLEYPPQLEALHCIRQASGGTGGESQYVDGFYVAEQIRKDRPDVFELLSTIPVEYVDEGKDFTKFFNLHRYPVINLDQFGKVQKVIVNDGVRSWFVDIPFEKQLEFYQALKYFGDECNKPENCFQVMLNPGDIVIFDNLRLLHARSRFETNSISGNNRLLEGVYFNYDAVRSKIRLLRKTLHPEETMNYFSF